MNTDFIQEIVNDPGNLWDLPELQDADVDVDVELYDDNSRGTSFESLLESGHDF